MSMYAYWLANTGLTVHKLTGLMTEGIGAEELYALQESQMKKIGFWMKRMWERLHNPGGNGMYRSAGENCRGRNRFCLRGRCAGTRKSSAGFLQHLMRCIILAGCRMKRERVWQLSGRGQEVPMEARLRGKLARALAQNRMDIISGMAMGIDADAHSGALEENGDTYAVLGCGVDVCYPKRNRYLYEKMQDRGGILSEYPPGTPPLPGYFPQRNRIIAGLADYVIVMEARKKSGSLITADYAMEQGKEVYALPGRVTDALSEGTNHLIQQGAGIFVSVEDFLQELQLQPKKI